ncbi:energy-coupling factor ABC transporter substrate-binding protein [Rhodopila globiformis]|uniref:Cobalt transport protein CbiN n=1 Tax=Rhodopila globiformis TaxID=1071 RepID=A0A2S6NGM5_RHOGL|nr:energy-coupling factor ABC transporter substrate-binding protein [Rhodopila globiformis]PPQ33734.1 cobalt ABC transporter substrate-binding protein CbiN [Rhodopila globiformis]
MRTQNILLALGAVALATLPLALITPGGDHSFGGSDDQATAMIQKLDPGYHRWFKPLWQPPSSEVESLLFGVQAAIGAGAVGYVLGYVRGRRTKRDGVGRDDAARD